MFAQPRQIRRLAAHVLLVWLFVLGVGVANACVVQMGLHHSAETVAPCHEAVLESAQSGQATQGDHQPDRTHPPCQRLCDGPSAVTQAEKTQSNPLNGFWLASAPLPSVTFQSWAEPSGIVPSDDPHWRQAVPIPIAFLRLAL
jgi:hypothetical protein